MVFCNQAMQISYEDFQKVTILILIDGFLQYHPIDIKEFIKGSHNPYFNRWFSAIWVQHQEGDYDNASQSLF